jgi:hypothetical protein
MAVDPAVGDLRVSAKALLSDIANAERHLVALQREDDAVVACLQAVNAQHLATTDTQRVVDARLSSSASNLVTLRAQLHQLEVENAAIEADLAQLTHSAALLSRVLTEAT